MAKWQRWIWLGVAPVAAGALIAWWGSGRQLPFLFARPHPAATPVTPATQDNPAARVQFVGTASCSARGCHGALLNARPPASLEPDRCLQNEYVRWTADPHARAYQVLLEKRSQRISEFLAAGTGTLVKAHEDPRCLACHVNPHWTGLSLERRPHHDERLFGVGCESCHGPAGQWLVPHTDSSWRSLSPGVKSEQYGMIPVADPARLARTCAGCHVGAPPHESTGLPLRDVNHDLIAAGHPRLNFEFASYVANLQPHWRPRARDGTADWTMGQYASAWAALDLLSERARKGPWPEFAEYDCYACHHALTEPSWRQKQTRLTGDRPGSLAWGTWYFPLLRDQHLDELGKVMAQPMPDRGLVQDMAQIGRSRFQPPPRQNLKPADMLRWLGDASARTRRDWDGAEQIYLGLCACNASQPDEAMTKLLQELTPLRAFAPGFDSPNSWPTAGRRAFHPSDFFDRLPWPAQAKR